MQVKLTSSHLVPYMAEMYYKQHHPLCAALSSINSPNEKGLVSAINLDF